MKTLEQLKKNIENKNIKPKSKSSFLYKEWFMWSIGIGSIVLGGVSVSASIFVIKNTQWAMHNLTHDSLFIFVLEYLPIIWLVFFMVFIFLAYLFFRHTKKGYKYNFMLVVGGVLLLTFIFGVISFTAGFGSLVDRGLGKRTSFYKDIEKRGQEDWRRSEEGLFIGKVFVEDDKYFLTFDGEAFEIKSDDMPEYFINILNESERVRVVGILEDDGIYPCMMFPFEIEEKKIFSQSAPKNRNEINLDAERSNKCRGVRPYAKLQ